MVLGLKGLENKQPREGRGCRIFVSVFGVA